jgi:hypothetical protein
MHAPCCPSRIGRSRDDADVWELYDGTSDYSQARDLAAEHPGTGRVEASPPTTPLRPVDSPAG